MSDYIAIQISVLETLKKLKLEDDQKAAVLDAIIDYSIDHDETVFGCKWRFVKNGISVVKINKHGDDL